MRNETGPGSELDQEQKTKQQEEEREQAVRELKRLESRLGRVKFLWYLTILFVLLLLAYFSFASRRVDLLVNIWAYGGAIVYMLFDGILGLIMGLPIFIQVLIAVVAGKFLVAAALLVVAIALVLLILATLGVLLYLILLAVFIHPLNILGLFLLIALIPAAIRLYHQKELLKAEVSWRFRSLMASVRLQATSSRKDRAGD